MASRPRAVAPRIWSKFSAAEKRWWRMLYGDFVVEWGISKNKLSVEQREVIASNHATMAVWAFRKTEFVLGKHKKEWVLRAAGVKPCR